MNHRRKKPKSRTHRSYSGRGQPCYFLRWQPRWFDIIFHRRPHRRKTARMEFEVLKGTDSDFLAWPVSNRPEKYYW